MYSLYTLTKILLIINTLSIVLGQLDFGIILRTMGYSKKDFGKYELKVRFVGECSSSVYTNKKNAVDHKTLVTKNEVGEEITGYSFVKQTHKVIKASFVPQIWRNGSFKTVINWVTETPCIDPIVSLPLYMTFHLDNSCIIKKGNYTIQGIYPDKLAHKIVGEKCINGRVRAVLKYFSKLGCTYCTELIVDISRLI